MSNYIRNKARAIYIEKMPTLTDQSAAEGTDINVIVRQLERTGMMRGSPIPGTNADLVGIADNLKDAIEQMRAINAARGQLPEQLRGMSLQELMALTPKQIADKIAPPAPPQEPPKEGPK